MGLAGALLLLSACASNSERFYWGNYEGALYTYSKKPDHGPEYVKALESVVAGGRKKNRVAPGMLAELGYMRLEQGDKVSAAKLFDEEMSLFPESKPFLTSVVARITGQPSETKSTAQ